LAAFFVFGTGQALADHVSCGDTITQTTTLDSDLLNCPGDGIVIGADNITLDLNGHLVDGTGFPTTGAGIDNSAGHDRVTVAHGRIREFGVGLKLTNADTNVITGLNVFESGNSMVSVQGDSDENVISRNVAGGQIELVGDTDANLIERNTVAIDFGTAVTVSSGAPSEIPDRNRIEHNTMDIPFHGIDILGAFDTTVERNTVTGAGLGILSAGVRTRIIQNTVRDSIEHGISVSGETDGELVRNQLVDNDDDGINVASTAVRTRLSQNTASRNGDDGIDVESASTTLTRNTANDNGDFGIEAIPGVTDGGGNKARGNGNPAQCLNVRCK
jgi:parallel beta-helix repeat protein